MWVMIAVCEAPLSLIGLYAVIRHTVEYRRKQQEIENFRKLLARTEDPMDALFREEHGE